MESCLGGKNKGGKGNEKLYVLERKNKNDIFVSIGSIFLPQSGQFFCFLAGGFYLQIWGLF